MDAPNRWTSSENRVGGAASLQNTLLNNETYGVAIVDHPDNPRYPTTWWVRNRKNYCLIHPSPVYYEPFHLDPDEVLTLQYSVVLYRGKPDAALFV